MRSSRARTLAVIPARGGSKRLPGKNIRPIAGRPLLAYSILTARSCRGIDDVVVSSDDVEILEAAEAWGARLVRRPDALSSDVSPTIAAMQHALATVEAMGEPFDHVALFQPTCPLRRVVDVEACMEEYLDSGADSALSVTEIHLKAGRRDAAGCYKPNYAVGIRKQDVEPLYQENGALYFTRADLIRRGTLLGERTTMFELPSEAGVASIDTEFDFVLTDALYEKLNYEAEFSSHLLEMSEHAA